jgi:hypothetical protein
VPNSVHPTPIFQLRISGRSRLRLAAMLPAAAHRANCSSLRRSCSECRFSESERVVRKGSIDTLSHVYTTNSAVLPPGAPSFRAVNKSRLSGKRR